MAADRPSTVAVDFDGVIHAYSRGWQDGSIYDGPLPGAFDGLRSLMERYAVMIHTTRAPADVARWIKAQAGIETAWHEDENAVPEFWNEQGVILVTRRKLPAIAYIDDRAIRFGSWPQALADLKRLTSPVVPADPDRPCPHENFSAAVGVNRLTDEAGTVNAFSAEITVECAACGEKFRWIGADAGLSPGKPMVSVDEFTLRAPIRPASADPDFGLGIPGFSIRQSG
jgi:hypothetical protein